MIPIPQDEVHFLQKRQRDDTGRVFVWKDRIFRAIFRSQEAYVRSFFTTGFLNSLVSNGLFPRTWITDYQLGNHPLILEHEKIWPVIYPQEWTFTMLKDAALMVNRTYLSAKRHKFNMRDCHGLNVLFSGIVPQFVDLGSFIPDVHAGWNSYEEFLRFYYYPLRIWQQNAFVGKLSIFSGNLTLHDAYLRCLYPPLRGNNPHLLNWTRNAFILPEVKFNRYIMTNSQSNRSAALLVRKTALKLFKHMGCVRPMTHERVVKRIERIEQYPSRTQWAVYHDEVQEKALRFNRIIEIINALNNNDIKSLADLGGNQGLFCRLLAKKTQIERIVCIDDDENAVDEGYRKEKLNPTGKISYANFDFMGGIAKLRFMLPHERYKSDAATALAISHHLILTQGYAIEEVFRYISSYARKYVFIEFMPLGLWATGKTPSIPSWYTLDWFRSCFTNSFDLILEEKLRTNNVMFVGSVRTS